MKLHDSDIREPLFGFLENEYGIVRIIEEKTAGKARADVIMVVHDAVYGIEIKSDADTYTRLAKQVKYYNQYFDYNYVTVGISHAMHIEEHVPAFWGIIIAEQTDEGMDFYIRRRPLPNPKVKIEKKVTLLWRPELVHIQERYKMPKYREKSKAFVQKKLLEKLTVQQLNEEISQELFERDYTLIEEEIRRFKENKTQEQ